MITQWYSPDYNMEYRVTIPSAKAWENLNEIFAWAKQKSQGNIIRGNGDWIHQVGTFTAGILDYELAIEFMIRFG